MTLLALGFAAEFRERGIAANALWPKTVIATAAVQNLLGGDAVIRASRHRRRRRCAYAILTADGADDAANTYIDEDVWLRAGGMTDFSAYAIDPSVPLRHRLSSWTSSSDATAHEFLPSKRRAGDSPAAFFPPQ